MAARFATAKIHRVSDLVLKTLQEMRAEAKESREETRDNFGKVFHRLAVVETHVSALQDQMSDVRHRLGSLERHMAALLATMPTTSERIDKLEARLAALEARLPS
jgi:chromosome segregation ATPase